MYSKYGLKSDTDIKIVNVNFNDLKSIDKAEGIKERLKNEGYELKETITEMNKAKLIYVKDKYSLH